MLGTTEVAVQYALCENISMWDRMICYWETYFRSRFVNSWIRKAGGWVSIGLNL